MGGCVMRAAGSGCSAWGATMKRPPFKWTDLGLMFVGGAIAAAIYVLVSGDY